MLNDSAPVAQWQTLPLLTFSRMDSFGTCPRQHFIKYVAGIVPARTAEPLFFGSLGHGALEAWYGWHRAPDFRTDALTCALASIPPEGVDPYLRAKLEAMLFGYDAMWSEWARTVTVLGIEEEFNMPLVNPATGAISRTYQLAGKLDNRLRFENARLCVGEHKFTMEDASVGSDYRKKLRLDRQIGQYVEGATVLGDAVDGVLYDVIVKPGCQPYQATPMEQRTYTQPKSRACKLCGKKSAPPAPHEDPETGTLCVDGRVVTDPGGKLYANMREFDESPEDYRKRCFEAIRENPERYYHHIEVVRLESERIEHGFDVWRTAKMIRECELAETSLVARGMDASLAWARNSRSCFKWGSACAYWSACTGTAQLDDPVLYRRVSNVHQELTQAK